MAIQTTVTTSKHATHIAFLSVSDSLLKTHTCHNYSNISDNTEFSGHRTPAAKPTIRGKGSPLAITRRYGPTSSTQSGIGKTTDPYGIRDYTHQKTSHQSSKNSPTCPHNNATSNKTISPITQTCPKGNPYTPTHDHASPSTYPPVYRLD